MEDTLWGESSPRGKQARSRPAALRPPQPHQPRKEQTQKPQYFFQLIQSILVLLFLWEESKEGDWGWSLLCHPRPRQSREMDLKKGLRIPGAHEPTNYSSSQGNYSLFLGCLSITTMPQRSESGSKLKNSNSRNKFEKEDYPLPTWNSVQS